MKQSNNETFKEKHLQKPQKATRDLSLIPIKVKGKWARYFRKLKVH